MTAVPVADTPAADNAAATRCRRGGCGQPVADGSEWCDDHDRALKRFAQAWDNGQRESRPPKPKPPVCTVETCDRQAVARGWCSMHYNRWWSTGKTEASCCTDPAPCTRHRANPWAGRQPCPACRSAELTMPYGPPSKRWVCVACNEWFTP